MVTSEQRRATTGQTGAIRPGWFTAEGKFRVPSLVVMSILVLFFSFPLVVWIYNSQYMRFVADDFCFASSVRANGPLSVVLTQYREFQARYTATFLYGLLSQIGYSSIWIAVVAVLSTWFLAFVWVFYQIATMCRMNRPVIAGISAGIVALFSVFSASPAMLQPLYWLSGQVCYVFPMIGFTLWVGGMLAFVRRGLSRPVRVSLMALNFAIGFLLGGFPESYVVFQIVACSLALVATKMLVSSDHKHDLALGLTAALIGSIAALVVQVSAPGTAARQSYYMMGIPAIERVVESLKFIPFGYSRFASVVLPCCFVLTILIARTHLQRVELTDPRNVVKVFAATGAASILLLWATKFPSIYIMWPYLPPPRVLLLSTTISVITMMSWGVLVAMLLPHLSLHGRRVWNMTLSLLGLAALIVPIYEGLISLKTTAVFQEFAQAWDARQDTILSQRMAGATDIQIPPMPLDVYTLLQLDPIASDPTTSYYWVNGCMAAYYHVNSILASESR